MAYNTKKYYDEESVSYSDKRYEGELRTYVQFLFRKRLHIFLGMLEKILPPEKQTSIFEVGCADGIIMGRILSRFSPLIGKMKGIDISDKMVESARVRYPDPRLSFALRGEEGSEKYDVVAELGVHVESLEAEIGYIKTYLKEGGHFIFSCAGRNSLHARIKLANAPYRKDYMIYSEAEAILGKHFEIIDAQPYGLFVPKLWVFVPLARAIQPIAELLLRPIAPSLFHEKIYLLKLK